MSPTKVVPLEQLGELVSSGSFIGRGGSWLSIHPMVGSAPTSGVASRTGYRDHELSGLPLNTPFEARARNITFLTMAPPTCGDQDPPSRTSVRYVEQSRFLLSCGWPVTCGFCPA